MPPLELKHPPPSRPAVADESIKDLEFICQIVKTDPAKMKSIEENFGPAGPMLARWISKERITLLAQMEAHGLARRFAVYDSHNIEGLLNPERGHLRYFRGDVIEVLRRCNDTWAIGLLRGNVGLFPLEHTRSDNFSLVFTSYTAKSAAEVSVNRGQVVPTTATTVPGRCQIYTTKESGLVPRQNLASMDPPPTQEQSQDTALYYQYPPLQRDHIRLIYITPENVQEFEASGKQSLFITLSNVSLSKVPTYAAFSYCWGDSTDITPVFCNGKLLHVPSSLWRLLTWHVPGANKNVYLQYDATHATRFKEPAVFWADAICINQRDILEKNHQIPLMQAIYQKANQVIAYAGESDTAMVAGLSMDMIAQTRQRNQSSSARARGDADYGADRADWDAVKQFFSQPLFRRCWVIQEIILSREITFCYGTMRILMSRIHDCSLALSENNLRPANSVLGDTYGRQAKNSENFNEGLRQILNLSRLKATWDQGGGLPFIVVLQSFRSAEATDPRDKVYSLLSLASEEYRRSITPDYSTSNTAVAVYEHVARCALQLQDLEVLLPNAGISRKNPAMASWAPDWSHEPREVINGSLFSCSGCKVYGSAHVSPFMHHNRAKLIIRGSIIDKVSIPGPRWNPNTECELPDLRIAKASGNAQVAFFLTNAFIEMTKRPAATHGGRYSTSSGVSTAVWQTLVCGTMRGDLRAVPGDEAHYNAFLECKANQAVLSRGVSNQPADASRGSGDQNDDDDFSAKLEKVSLDFGLGPLDRKPAAGAGAGGSSRAIEREETKRRKLELEERAMPFLKALVKAQAGRRTCITERSYFAAVPDAAMKGDEIAIFFGHPLPYVVRRTGDSDAAGHEQFRLVGHCYVHGIMDGELMDKAIPGFNAMDFALI